MYDPIMSKCIALMILLKADLLRKIYLVHVTLHDLKKILLKHYFILCFKK